MDNTKQGVERGYSGTKLCLHKEGIESDWVIVFSKKDLMFVLKLGKSQE